jgi:hypothetical protein
MPANATPSEELQRIMESAGRLGVELDEADAIQWLTAIASAKEEGSNVVIDVDSGVFGHRVTMLDFSPADLAHFRKIGDMVQFSDRPGVVETALALSGSAAQSKIQSYPGDADYFERVNIKAATREEACQILAEIMKEKALDTASGPTYQLIEVKLGSYPEEMVVDGRTMPADSPISWTVATIKAGRIEGLTPAGEAAQVTWEQAAADPGWCKLDWVVADAVRETLVNASNMLDVTWEAPDGGITPLDGYLDPYFQEVYLEAESIPVFTKLAKQVDSNALDGYVDQLEKEVRKYVTKDPNYGKAAKRMYNIFRLTGRYEEAAFLRELFDEPTTILYRVWALIRTIDDCFKPGSSITLDALLKQTDDLIINVTDVMEGEKESEIVRLLLRLRDILSRHDGAEELSPPAEAARAEVINVVNNFFYEKLTGVPTIKAYIDGMSEK